MEQKATFCKTILHPKSYLLVMYMALAVSCSKKEIHTDSNQEITEQVSAEEVEQKSNKEIFEIFNPLGRYKKFSENSLLDLNHREESYKYFEEFYATKTPVDLYGNFLNSRYKQIYFKSGDDFVSGYDYILKPVSFDLVSKEEYYVEVHEKFVEEKNRALWYTSKFVLAEGSVKEIDLHNDELMRLAQISPESVISAENQMLSSSFKPFCILNITKSNSFEGAKAWLLRTDDAYLAFSRPEMFITRRDNIKVVVSDVIIKSFGEYLDYKTVQEKVKEAIKGDPVEIYKSYEPSRDVKLKCVSTYKGESEEVFLKNMLSSVFKNTGVKVESRIDVDILRSTSESE